MSVNGVSTKYFDEFKRELLKNKSKTVSVGLDQRGVLIRWLKLRFLKMEKLDSL